MVNPYLMGQCHLAACDDGIVNKLDPGAPEERNIYQAIKDGKDVKKLPMSLGDALTLSIMEVVIVAPCPVTCTGCITTTRR